MSISMTNSLGRESLNTRDGDEGVRGEEVRRSERRNG